MSSHTKKFDYDKGIIKITPSKLSYKFDRLIAIVDKETNQIICADEELKTALEAIREDQKYWKELLDRNCIEQSIQTINHENAIQIVISDKNGPEKKIEVLIFQLVNGNKSQVAFIGNDFTLVEEQIDQLKETIHVDQILLDNISSGLILFNPENFVTFVNRTGLKYLNGLKKEEVLGKEIINLFEDHLKHKLEEYLNLAITKKKSMWFTEKLGNKTMQWILTPIIFDDEILLVELNFMDVSMIEDQKRALKQKNQELKEANKKLEVLNKKLDRFVSIVSHDLKDPARRIVSFGELLQNSATDRLTNTEKEWIKIMVDGAKHLYNMINALVNYSRIDSQKITYQKLDMKKIIEFVTTVSLQERIDNTNAKIEVSEDIPYSFGDISLVMQVWQNLIQNAIKFSRKGVPPHIKIWGEKRGEWIIYYCKDNGIGIPIKKKDEIFEMFRKLGISDQEGTGIGLALVKKIIEIHGGSIECRPNVNESGTTFVFSLPYNLVE